MKIRKKRTQGKDYRTDLVELLKKYPDYNLHQLCKATGVNYNLVVGKKNKVSQKSFERLESYVLTNGRS